MKRLFPGAAVLGALLMLQSVMWAAPKTPTTKAPIVTRDNFVSLDYARSSRTNEKVQLVLNSSALRYNFFPGLPTLLGGKSGLDVMSVPSRQTAVNLSPNQLNTLIGKINELKLPALAGDYRQPVHTDESTETLILIISDENNRDRTYTIHKGPAAPTGFSEMTDFLSDFWEMKTSALGHSTVTAGSVRTFTRTNWKTLTLSISGGFANLKSELKVSLIYPNPDLGNPALMWSQNLPGKKEQIFQRKLSVLETTEIIRLLNAAKLESLNGQNFRQKNLADGFNEVLTAELNDGQKFTVSNYGDQAPPEYFALTQYLNELKDKKFNDQK